MEGSILSLVKKLIGGMDWNEEFDPDILVSINSSLMALYQIGIGKIGFIVTSNEETWKDFLGDDYKCLAYVQSYVASRAKLEVDTPASSAAVNALNEVIKEATFRIEMYAESEKELREE